MNNKIIILGDIHFDVGGGNQNILNNQELRVKSGFPVLILFFPFSDTLL